eukprot:SAG25_NODE_287_length_10351_cov_22.194499_5_plen_127_part_00
MRALSATQAELTTRVGDTNGTFQLMGADFIVEDRPSVVAGGVARRLVPWLTEVQTGPGLSHDEPVKAAVMPQLLDEAVQIALAVQRTRRAEELGGGGGEGSRRGAQAWAALADSTTVWQTLVNEAA